MPLGGGLGDDDDDDDQTPSDAESNVPHDLRRPKFAKKPAASKKVAKKPSSKRTKKRGDEEDYLDLPPTYRHQVL